MEYENKYASNEKGNLGVTLGAIGTGLGVLSGGLGNIGGLFNANGGCSDDHYVNRYELNMQNRISELETEVKLRDANTFTLGELDKMKNYFENKFNYIEAQLCEQKVYNATVNSTVTCLSAQINQLMSLTKTVVPAENICPPPMPLYNSWTAPTTT